MTNEEAIIVLEHLKSMGGLLCRTEKEALSKAIEMLESAEEEDEEE